MSFCPETGTLLAFLEERLATSQCVEIERHVETCPRCAGEMERLTADDGELLPIAPILPVEEAGVQTASFRTGTTLTISWPEIPDYNLPPDDKGGQGRYHNG
jgi:hypothetical protein